MPEPGDLKVKISPAVAAPLTTGRVLDIESGHGRPPTEDELRQIADHNARMAPSLAKLAEILKTSEAKKARARKALQIFEGMGPEQRRRWGHRSLEELLAHHLRTAPRPHTDCRHARQRSRRVTGSRSSRGSPRRADDP